MFKRSLKTLSVAGVLTTLSLGPGFADEVSDDTAPAWRAVEPENLMIIELARGNIVIELNDDFAPGHVAQMQKLSADKAYDGHTFYRVIDGFVAQGGLDDDDVDEGYPLLANENDRPISAAEFTPLGNADLFTETVGHIDGFPVGRSEALGREWLLHCPGAIAMARDNDPDSGGTDFYIVLDAQRYLDRNLTVFGRVISGMQHVQAVKRGVREIESGVIQPPEQGDEFLSIRVASDLPEDVRPQWEVMETTSAEFDAFKTSKRVRNEPFFYRHPPEVLDVCSFATPAREVTKEETSASE